MYPTGSNSPCCSSKRVGDVSYKLLSESDTSAYGCQSSCIYESADEPGKKYCFKSGNLTSTCLGGGEGMTGAMFIVMEAKEVRQKELKSVMEQGIEEWEKSPDMTTMEEMTQLVETINQGLETIKSLMTINTYSKGTSSR